MAHDPGAYEAMELPDVPLPLRAERRRTPREEAFVAVTWRPGIGSPLGRCTTTDASERGLCLHTGHRFPIGHELDLDVEVYLPLRVHLGYTVDALVIDGPEVTHSARLRARVQRCESVGDGTWETGVEFLAGNDPSELRVIDLFLEHLREAY
jgi:hypothetical protein